ncbi:MAG: hypothetical protein SGJ02_04910 [bacterium]|nr:hypothetical protein [bacterium]
MKNLIKFSIFCISLLSLFSCGGGGGSGSGSSSGVRLINAGMDAPPATVISTLAGSEAPLATRFATTSDRFSAEAGSQRFLVNRGAIDGTTLASVSADYNPEIPSSLILFGDQDALGLRVILLSDDAGEIPKGKVAIKVVHTLNKAAEINFALTSTLGNSSGEVSYGQASSYQIIDPGLYRLSVSRSADNLQVISQEHTFLAGESYTIVVCGEVDFFVKAAQFVD